MTWRARRQQWVLREGIHVAGDGGRHRRACSRLMDFNADGHFDESERPAMSQWCVARWRGGPNPGTTIADTIPANAVDGRSPRVPLGTEGLTWFGPAPIAKLKTTTSREFPAGRLQPQRHGIRRTMASGDRTWPNSGSYMGADGNGDGVVNQVTSMCGELTSRTASGTWSRCGALLAGGHWFERSLQAVLPPPSAIRRRRSKPVPIAWWFSSAFGVGSVASPLNTVSIFQPSSAVSST